MLKKNFLLRKICQKIHLIHLQILIRLRLDQKYMEKTRIIMSILFVSLLISCKDVATDFESDNKTKEERIIHKKDPLILIVDDCEYILYKEKEGTNWEHGYMAHKGNCNNPIHRYNILDTIGSGNSIYIELKNNSLGSEKDKK